MRRNECDTLRQFIKQNEQSLFLMHRWWSDDLLRHSHAISIRFFSAVLFERWSIALLPTAQPSVSLLLKDTSTRAVWSHFAWSGATFSISQRGCTNRCGVPETVVFVCATEPLSDQLPSVGTANWAVHKSKGMQSWPLRNFPNTGGLELFGFLEGCSRPRACVWCDYFRCADRGLG